MDTSRFFCVLSMSVFQYLFFSPFYSKIYNVVVVSLLSLYVYDSMLKSNNKLFKIGGPKSAIFKVFCQGPAGRVEMNFRTDTTNATLRVAMKIFFTPRNSFPFFHFYFFVSFCHTRLKKKYIYIYAIYRSCRVFFYLHDSNFTVK